LLTPTALVVRAAARGVDVLALTDHDELSGLAEARKAAREAGIALVCGCELSVSWEGTTIHVVALGIDPEAPALIEGLAAVRAGRSDRARRIGEALAAAGVDGAYAGAMRHVTSERLISRTHFARFLVEAGHAREMKDVFKRYLVQGKPGYVPHQWATLTQAVSWIRAAGGRAVLAHPGRYKLGSGLMGTLLEAFRDERAMRSKCSPSHTSAQITEFTRRLSARLVVQFPDRAKAGSTGGTADLPAGVMPVWAD
jgi:predicted metal-dependent phosphoesterase TrpH